MEETNFDLILKALKNNYDAYDNKAQHRDADLICNLLRIKYNSYEISDVSSILVKKIINCLDKNKSWFTNY